VAKELTARLPSIHRAAGGLRELLASHRQLALILVLFLAFRLAAVWVFKPGGYLGELSDFGYYRLLLSFTNQGFLPLIDFWVEYPPIFPWLMLGLYRLSLLVPAWTQPGAWFYMTLSTFLVLVEAANLVVLYALAHRLHGAGRAVRLAWVYTALLAPVLTLFGGFDSLALLFLLLAVWWTLGQRPILGGLAAGLGFMTKMMPIVALPAAWQHMMGLSRRLRLVLAALLSILAVAAPFLLTAPKTLLQSLLSPMARSSWETLWALIDGYYSFGVAGGWNRFDPTTAGAAQHPTHIPWLLVTALFLLLYLFLFTRRVDWGDGRRVVAFTALGLGLLLLYSKGYSPQFVVLLLPFILLLIPGWRGVAYALLLSLLNLAEYPVYFLLLPGREWFLAGAVLLRSLIWVVLCLEYAAQVYGWKVPDRRWSRLAAGVTALVLAAGVAGAVLGLPAYAQSRYEASPHRPAIDILRREAEPGASLVVGEMETYEALYPFLRKQLRLSLIETNDYLPAWEPRLAAHVEGAQGRFWLYAPPDSAMNGWMSGHYRSVTSYDLGGWLLSSWETP